jgi:predicted transcriptional regulator
MCMNDPLTETLKQEMECEEVLKHCYGFNQLAVESYLTLLESDEAMTVDELAVAVDRDRSTVYRTVQQLLQAGFLRKEQVNYDAGGYYHVYKPKDPKDVADEMQQTLNSLYSKLERKIRECERDYLSRT